MVRKGIFLLKISGRSEPRITETVDTKSVDMGAAVFMHFAFMCFAFYFTIRCPVVLNGD